MPSSSVAFLPLLKKNLLRQWPLSEGLREWLFGLYAWLHSCRFGYIISYTVDNNHTGDNVDLHCADFEITRVGTWILSKLLEQKSKSNKQTYAFFGISLLGFCLSSMIFPLFYDFEPNIWNYQLLIYVYFYLWWCLGQYEAHSKYSINVDFLIFFSRPVYLP